jgi:hypothetical protein
VFVCVCVRACVCVCVFVCVCVVACKMQRHGRPVQEGCETSMFRLLTLQKIRTCLHVKDFLCTILVGRRERLQSFYLRPIWCL